MAQQDKSPETNPMSPAEVRQMLSDDFDATKALVVSVMRSQHSDQLLRVLATLKKWVPVVEAATRYIAEREEACKACAGIRCADCQETS